MKSMGVGLLIGEEALAVLHHFWGVLDVLFLFVAMQSDAIIGRNLWLLFGGSYALINKGIETIAAQKRESLGLAIWNLEYLQSIVVCAALQLHVPL